MQVLLGGKRLKTEDFASLPKVIKTYCFYLFYLLRHVLSRSTMLDYFQQRLSCISGRTTLASTAGKSPHIGLVSSEVRVWPGPPQRLQKAGPTLIYLQRCRSY